MQVYSSRWEFRTFDNCNSVLELTTATLELSLILRFALEPDNLRGCVIISFNKNTADLIYIRAIIFQATGNPAPEIIWFKGESPIKESSRVAVVNSNTELRLSNIRNSDLDEYTCIARNGVDKISFSTRVVQAG